MSICLCPFVFSLCVWAVLLPLFVCAVGVCVAATDGEHPGLYLCACVFVCVPFFGLWHC